jgi:phage-related protein
MFQLYGGGQFFWWTKPEKTTDMSQVSDKLSHNVVSSTPRLSGIPTHNVGGDTH